MVAAAPDDALKPTNRFRWVRRYDSSYSRELQQWWENPNAEAWQEAGEWLDSGEWREVPFEDEK